MPSGSSSLINRLGVRDYILVIAEKPRAAQKIAEALYSYKRFRINGVPIYVARWGGSVYVIAPAAGHLFTLDTEDKGYPTFNFKWVPRYIVDKDARFTKKFLDTLQLLAKHAQGFVNACDYDIEGSLIGFMIIKYFGDVRKAKRAKFSSLTPQEVRKAFSNLNELDLNMVEAGYCRHILDWLWGINISRMLMDFYERVFTKRIVLSAGRVQSPTLAHAVDIILSRRWHVPIPYATIDIFVDLDGNLVKLDYVGEPLTSLNDVKNYIEKIKRVPYAVVESIKKEYKIIESPHPFNLPDLQSEAYRIYKISPYTTQHIAEDLYLEALISYPRTNSQKLPSTLNNQDVLEALAKNPKYSELVKKLFTETKGFLKPNNGPADDPAHPAIYPTGEAPRTRLKPLHEKIYDLIVRRYLATFAKPLRLLELKVTLNVHGLQYSLLGVKILDPGWLKYYPFYSVSENANLVDYDIREGMKLQIKNYKVRTKYTKPEPPPSRISLLKWMESVNIGTEATRAEIIEVLFRRGYLKSRSRSVDVTDLGLLIVFLLKKFAEDLLSVELTRRFEEKLKLIIYGKARCNDIVEEAKKVLVTQINNALKESHRLSDEVFKVVQPQNQDIGVSHKKCKVCGRVTEAGDLCIFHKVAYENIVKSYERWKAFGYSWSTYLQKLVKLRSTGQYVREVAEMLLKEKV